MKIKIIKARASEDVETKANEWLEAEKPKAVISFDVFTDVSGRDNRITILYQEQAKRVAPKPEVKKPEVKVQKEPVKPDSRGE